ncbi:hypothetical protein MP228_011823 [Amoeboaphelidium protococcarum]|nr:hypothetical protein MP228_011823 [Amoeboaphelidium protococcarum]
MSAIAIKASNSIGRSVFHALISRISIGQLTVVEEYAGTSSVNAEDVANDETNRKVYGSFQKGQLSAQLTVKDAYFYTRLLLHADIGFSEAYIMGEIVVDDLTKLLQIYTKNSANLNNLNLATASVGNIQYVITHNMLANTIRNSLSNISAHYDIGNELFTKFLDDSMMYSSAVFAESDGRGQDALYKAQMRKLQMIFDKARLKASDNVLEIGTGWGTFAIEAVKKFGCKVTSITLSSQQYAYACKRVSLLPSEHSRKIDIRLMDYRDLPKVFPLHSFNKIVSIEMIEAVGPQFLNTYFQVVNQMLDQRDGVMVFQCITMPETRYDAYCKGVDFIQKYIFPGGHCPSVTALTNAISTGTGNQLIIENLENIGVHYARTLREWRDRFLQTYDQLATFPKYVEKPDGGSGLIAQALGYGGTRKEPFYGQEFKNKWLYYLSYCEAGFKEKMLGNVQVVLNRDASWAAIEGQGLENYAL